MKRSRTVETNVSSVPSSQAESPSVEKGSRKQRWSFALRRRWFSSASSSGSRCSQRSVSEDVSDDSYLGAPARTILGRNRFGLLPLFIVYVHVDILLNEKFRLLD